MSETQFGQVMTDLSKGALPVVVVASLVAGAVGLGFWFGGKQTSSEGLAAQVGRLETQMQGMATQMQQINLTLAIGPKMPENVAYRADLLQFCLLNRELKCPEYR